MIRFQFVLPIACLLTLSSSFADSLFNVTVTSPGLTGFSDDFDSAENLINAFEDATLAEKIVGYNNNSAAVGTLNFRGIPITLSYDVNSTALRLQIPETGLDRLFDGNTRSESEDLLEEFFKTSGKDEIAKLLRALAKKTTNDPIAGNPNSLMSTQISNDFDNGFVQDVPLATSGENGGPVSNEITIGAEYRSLRQGGLDSNKITVPLGYTYRSKRNPRRKYSFKLPISQLDVEGAKAYHVGAGLAVSLPVSKAWTMTPSARYGLSGSQDFGSASQMVGGSLTNSFTFNLFGLRHTFGNMVGYYETLKLAIGDFEIDPDIYIVPLVNGYHIAKSTDGLWRGSSVSVYVIDTQFFGTDLAVEHSDEFGIGFTIFKRTTIGFNYLYAEKSKGFRFGFNFRF